MALWSIVDSKETTDSIPGPQNLHNSHYRSSVRSAVGKQLPELLANAKCVSVALQLTETIDPNYDGNGFQARNVDH